MYLPKNKYRIENVVDNKYIRDNGTPFAGSVIRTSNGIVFEGKDLNGIKNEVLPVRQSDTTVIERPYNDYFGPTDKDYENGFYTRYFLRMRNGKFIEVNNKQWLEKRDRKRVTPGQLRWILNGPVKDGSVNGIPYKGAATKNRETLQRLEKDFPGITDFFKSTSEFVR